MIGAPATEPMSALRYSSVLASIQCRSSNTKTMGRRDAPRSASARMASSTRFRLAGASIAATAGSPGSTDSR